MAWDARRPVPWGRLVREWALFAGVMGVVFLALFRSDASIGTFAGLAASGPVYVLFGALLAKFGYQRTTLRSLREARAARPVAPTAPRPRDRPAPTRRTSTGRSQHPRKQRR